MKGKAKLARTRRRRRKKKEAKSSDCNRRSSQCWQRGLGQAIEEARQLEASAGAGIRPGDKFQVYRTGTFYNLDLEPRTELSDMATEVVVKQVQPQFVVAEMQLSAEHLAIQRDDMVIAW